ncbi:uncharacterized protein LOC122379088 [Amphibalanus amphitrite]|uniref:uncharacterized protein LOC122379088 n=1 Tax=Amphibalanus amphitrite TaxID=1232801 RepID=UPI001C9263A4|nr:uncharacterized protein LOC122379088 [Amphibalanus amphitrite]
MAEVEELKCQVASISERFDRLEGLVEKISKQLSASQCTEQSDKDDNVGRRQVVPDEQQHQVMPSAVLGSFSEVQAEFRAIRDSVAKVKLPPDLLVGDSRAGVSRADLPRFNIIQKSARYQETVLKLLSACDPEDAALNQVSAVSLAHLRYLQEEYTQLLVSAQFDDGTAKLFSTLQQNPAAFTPNSLENLQRAVTIAGARQSHQAIVGRLAAVDGRGSSGLAVVDRVAGRLERQGAAAAGTVRCAAEHGRVGFRLGSAALRSGGQSRFRILDRLGEPRIVQLSGEEGD